MMIRLGPEYYRLPLPEPEEREDPDDELELLLELERDELSPELLFEREGAE